MGQYKVPQDVEAEDKLVGFLTLKQFIFAVIGASWLALSYFIFQKVPIFFIVLGLPFGGLFLMLGLYKRQDQPFEALFLAMVTYFSKPRKRIWVKEPIESVFSITPAPPKFEPITRNPEEVKGQLEKLVHVLESREGGVKHPELQEPTLQAQVEADDRIYMPEHLQADATPAEAPEVTASDDMLDLKNNPKAQDLDVLIEGAVKEIHDLAVKNMHDQRSVTPPKQPAPNPTPPPSAGKTPPPPSVSGMTVTPPDDILKKTLAASPLRVNQIAERVNQPAELKEGEVVKVEGTGQQNPEPTQQGQH